jgi:hypothetical protein
MNKREILDALSLRWRDNGKMGALELPRPPQAPKCVASRCVWVPVASSSP